MKAATEVRQATTRTRRRPPFPVIGWVGLAILGLFVTLAVAAPLLAGYDPIALSGDPLEAPSSSHLVGTNQIGQDLASQLLYGARASLLVAAMTAAGTLMLGATIGLVAGWAGGRTDTALMGVVDVFLATPRMPLLILIGAFAGKDLVTLAVIMSLVFWPPTARLIRAQVRSLRQRLHVRAALAFGAGTFDVMRRHVVPEIGLILVAALVAAASRAILFEAGLAFLGLGDVSRMSWGSIMRDARTAPGLFYSDAWLWWMFPAILAIILVLLGLTFVGVAVEQRVNPRLARHHTGGLLR